MRMGKLVEEGTHEELLQIEDGVYHGRVRAQALSMGYDDPAADDIALDDKRIQDPEIRVVGTKPTEQMATSLLPTETDETYKRRGFFRSFGLITYEQKGHWLLYAAVVIGAMAGGGMVANHYISSATLTLYTAEYPIQAYLFAQLIQTFTLTGQALIDRGNFWSLMFFIQAIGVFIAYFVLGWASHHASTVISTFYSKEYMQNILRKRIIFFDSDGNSAGTLTANLSTDSSQIEKLMGGEMSMAYISVFNLVGSLIISFAFGWKLSLLGVCTIIPVVIFAGYFRVKLEMQFEQYVSWAHKYCIQIAVSKPLVCLLLCLTCSNVIRTAY
jgi:ATP-binding cassette subfamily B (MDR/TAP) protein 1